MKTFVHCLVLAFASFLPPIPWGASSVNEPQEQPAPKKSEAAASKLSELMQRKEQLAHELFDALILKDFKRIRKRANSLVSISKDSQFQVHQTPRYMQYSEEFQAAAEKMIDKAWDKNAEGVASAFTEMTLSCLHCHDYVREKKGK
jgi:hypothetical protein